LNCINNISQKYYMVLQTKKDIEILLTKYLEKSCSIDEKKQFFELLASPDNEKSLKEIIFSHLTDFNEDNYSDQIVDSDRIYNQILTEIKDHEFRLSEEHLNKRRVRIRQLVIQGLAVAAVFCVAFFLGSIVTTRDGKVSAKKAGTAEYSEIRAPFGARSEIKLSDGTQVILNAGSQIRYPSDYNLNNRELILDGEAYFKVAKNTDLPLIVNAGGINIKATGTEFNVKAYRDEGTVETTLIEGKVEITQNTETSEVIKLLDLKPNQKAIYLKETDRLAIEKIKEIEPLAVKPAKTPGDKVLVSPRADVDQVTAWTQNKLIIRGENLENLCVKLQRKYNVTFVFGNEGIKKYRFSGVLMDETLEQVLKVIKLTSPVDFVIDKKVVLIVSNKEAAEKYLKHMKKSQN
jgi:transmembrane sensor